jgi:hypothetical protein
MATIADGKEYGLEVREVSGLDEEDLDQVKQLFLEYGPLPRYRSFLPRL